jgi:hypothetical protein
MKIPLKFPVAGSMLKTFSTAPRSLCQSEGNEPCAEDATVDAITRPRAMVKRYMFVSKLGELMVGSACSSPPVDGRGRGGRGRLRAISSTVDRGNIRT